VFKNPKKPKPRGASAMQPAAATANSGGSEGVKLVKGEVADVEGTMNDEKRWLKMKEGDVPVDQV
jgi:ribosome biogenesis protein MAK21